MNAETLCETTLALSAAVIAVLLARGPLRSMFGSTAVYAAWALVPAALFAVLLPAAVEPAAPARLVAGIVGLDVGPAAAAASAPGSVPWLLLAWLAGAAVTLGVFAVRQRDFRCALGTLRRRPDGLLQGAGTAGLPAVLGWPARIVLPADFERRYAPAEQALVLCHERVHLHRGDVPASAAAAALRCLFWFNPLVHVAAACFRQDQELACDAAVLRRFPGARRTYADALLKTQLAGEPLPVGCHWFGSHPLKERIAMLKRPVPGSTRRFVGFVFAAALAVGGAALAWAAQPAPAAGPRADGTAEGGAVERTVVPGKPVTGPDATRDGAPAAPGATADEVSTPAFDRLSTPEYPPASLAAGEGGTVWLKVLVAADGSPLRIEYDAEGSTLAADSPLTVAARDAMARSTFLPARKAGKPVDTWMRLPIRFEPEGGPDGTPEGEPEADLTVRG